MDKFRTTLTYRFSVLAGFYIIIAAILYKFMNTSSAAVFWAVMLIPLLFTTGLSLLIMDFVKPLRFDKLKLNNKFFILIETLLILIYIIVSGGVTLSFFQVSDINNLTDSLIVFGFFCAGGLLTALLSRFVIVRIIKK